MSERDEQWREVIKETLLNIEGVQEELSAVKRRLREHLDRLAVTAQDGETQ